MSDQFNASPQEAQSKFRNVSIFVSELLLPSGVVAAICQEIGFSFRQRVYSPMVVVWMFVMQTLSADHSCQQVVTRLNAWRMAQGLPRSSGDTTSYCQARRRLPIALFERLLAWTARKCDEAGVGDWRFQGREVVIVDGTTVTMADTRANQVAYPQIANQQPGCGFPLARIVHFFSLATGAATMFAMGRYAGKETGETSLLRTLLSQFHAGEIVLADRYYASFWLLALSELRGIDVVARAHHLRKIDFRRGLRQGDCDQVVGYRKPQRPTWMTQREYESHPSSILVRHLRYQVTQPGFRTRQITLATTLLQADVYRAEDLADLYRRRWQAELHIRSLKTQMQMDHLRCKSPAMVQKELHCHLIGYNLVRAAMLATALKFRLPPWRLSFTGAMQAVEEFAAALRWNPKQQQTQWINVLQTIRQLEVGVRPDRNEPRELKRRAKEYKLMQTPRNRYTTAA
ncbi:IS4 family transposase [Blastopirellula marina]|uniref:IS4/IS5 family transposase n=1 Tax=Blastopirellula marina TaxID=124 RepID=A0A2S8G6S7_9BACT|nr:IS4 family transposase [Blastopirellula marina]PQO40127.1 IS4/IS5 family transposase [Blastopirellula marina]PTL45494.1 IS4 family transposase [Blastopirellula marina]